MKLLRYGEPGRECPALLDADGRLRDLASHIADVAGAALRPQTLESLARINPAPLREVPGSPSIGPCVGGVGKIICVGLNYSDHAAESNMPFPLRPSCS